MANLRAALDLLIATCVGHPLEHIFNTELIVIFVPFGRTFEPLQLFQHLFAADNLYGLLQLPRVGVFGGLR
jgi:hypothetical protein